MRAFLQVFALEFRAVVRSGALALLAFAAVAIPLALPYVLNGDGTPDGEIELYVHYALGLVAFLLTVTLAATAAGTLAKDRAARRLALAAVRPAPRFVLALGRTVALTAVGALAFALAVAATVARLEAYPQFSLSRPCYHALSPILPKTPRQEAEEAYARYCADPATSNNVARVDRSVALDILTQRAQDRFDVIEPGASAAWAFAPIPDDAVSRAVRIKLANTFESRGEACGTFAYGERTASVSNATAAVVVVPLVGNGQAETSSLRFDNTGKAGVMLRPRKDLNLLYGRPGDTFAVNLVYASLATLALFALVVSFAQFLGACLARSVAVFATLVLLLAAEISPAILESCTEEAARSLGDRIGVAVTDGVARLTRPVGSAHPIETLSEGECLEPREVAATLATDGLLLPLLFAVLAGLAVSRKPD